MYPPDHTAKDIRQNSRLNYVVRFRGLCNICEERHLISRSIVEETKKLVQSHMAAYLDEEQTSSLTEGSVRWSKNKVVIDFKYRKTGQSETKEQHDDDQWGVFEVAVTPSASSSFKTRGSQWEEVYLDIPASSDLIHARLDLQSHIDAFERKWNVPAEGSGGARGSFASEADLSSAFPPFPELFSQSGRVLEDHYRYDDPDLLETLPFATAEDSNEEL